jgi:EmrB/QacA subfamily drug resistance transporter
MAQHLPTTHHPTFVLPFTATKRWTVLGMILASGIVFLDGTVVNVALPAIDRSLHIGLSGQQWVIDGYTLGLAAFLLLGGALGDRYGRRRVMLIGLAGFGVASVLCAAAPTGGFLIAARALQGVAGALLVPASLAIITAVFTDGEERGQAIGMWTGWSGIATVIGPFLGGWLVDAASWRWAFVINVPLIGAATFLLLRHVPETRDEEAVRRLDWAGAALAAIGLGGVTLALIEGPVRGWGSPLVVAGGIGGVAALALFVVVEARLAHPMVPLGFFRVRNFAAANLATLGVYFALGGATFLFVLFAQSVMGYTALAAGLTLLPISVLMLLLASRFGKLAGRYGPRFFMTVGPLVVAVGLLLFARLHAGSDYLTAVFPASVTLALGLCITVAPLTTTVMSAVPAHNSGIASAINNVAARVAGLLAVAGLGVVVAMTFASSLDTRAAGPHLAPESAATLAQAKQDPAARPAPELPPDVAWAITDAYTVAFHRAMWWCAVAAAAGGLISGLMIRNSPAHVLTPDQQKQDAARQRGGP